MQMPAQILIYSDNIYLQKSMYNNICLLRNLLSYSTLPSSSQNMPTTFIADILYKW